MNRQREAQAPIAPGRTELPSDDALVQALRDGRDDVFRELVERWSSAMLAVARSRVGRPEVAEEVVQEAWLTVLRDLDRFEGRSALRTWVLGIVVNLARSRARAERRVVAAEPGGPVVKATRFRTSTAARWPNHWAVPPTPWPEPETVVLNGELRRVLLGAIAGLPPRYREVLVLRDLEGLSAAEACDVLGLTDANQRVLLHRARSRVRSALERYFDATEAA